MGLNLAFATDGELRQVIGIASVLSALACGDLGSIRSQPIWVVTSEKQHNYVLDVLNKCCGSLDYRLLMAPISDSDRFFIQLGLSKVFEEVPVDESILCLDYDHIVIQPDALTLDPSLSGIIVSSENPDQQSGMLVRTGTRDADEAFAHHNISLISGRASELNRVGKLWYDSYTEITPYTTYRWRSEQAFSLAAAREGIPLTRCEPRIQSNFSCPYRNSALFHYGGDGDHALQLKQMLMYLSGWFFTGWELG